MTTRQGIEIATLALLCVLSLRMFWLGSGFTPTKKLGVGLAVVVFVGVSLIILHGH
jgi:hypothetical protein